MYGYICIHKYISIYIHIGCICIYIHCSTLQHTATRHTTLQHTNPSSVGESECQSIAATHCNALQHIATHFNTLQHTATHQSIFSEAERVPESSCNSHNAGHTTVPCAVKLVAASCSALQCAVTATTRYDSSFFLCCRLRCSVLQRVAVCCNSHNTWHPTVPHVVK